MKGRHAVGALMVIVMLIVAAAPVAAWSFTPGGQGPSQEGFVPMKDLPQSEQLPAAPLVIIAYAVVWVVLLAYVWSVWRRLSVVRRDLDELARRIEKKAHL